MNLKRLLGMIVLDSNAKEIGKIRDVEFDDETGKVTDIYVSLKKNILSNDEALISFDLVKSMGDYVLVDTTVENVKESIIKDNDDSKEDKEDKKE